MYSILELPSVLPVVQLSEALLRLEKGAYMLTRLIANMPDTFDQGNIASTYTVCGTFKVLTHTKSKQAKRAHSLYV